MSLNYIFPVKSAGRQCIENSFAVFSVFSVITRERKLRKKNKKETIGLAGLAMEDETFYGDGLTSVENILICQALVDTHILAFLC